MGRPQQFLCENSDGNCPNYVRTAVVTVGGAEKFVCPLGITDCERKHLKPIAPPPPAWLKFLKTAAVVLVPIICIGLVWWYVASRPPPRLVIKVFDDSQSGAQIRAGGSKSWLLQIVGGPSAARPEISVESLSAALVSKNGLLVEKVENRKFRLTAQTIAGQTGRAEIKVSTGTGTQAAVTNLVFEVEPPPPLDFSRITPAATATAENLQPGQDMTWTFAVEGGTPSEKPQVHAESLTPSVVPQASLSLEPIDDAGRNFKLLAHPLSGQTGLVNIKISIQAGSSSNEMTLSFNILASSPPTLTLLSPPLPLDMANNSDSLLVWFKLADDVVAPGSLVFTAESTPAGRVLSSIKADGPNRIITLSRNAKESGAVKLNVRVMAGDREADQSYDVVIEPRITQVVSDPNPLLLEVQRLVAAHQFDAALAKIKQIVVDYPQLAKAWRVYGTVVYSMKRFPEAIDYSEKALSINPQEAEAWFIEGASYESQTKIHEAIPPYKRWMELTTGPDPRKARISQNLQTWAQQGIQ